MNNKFVISKRSLSELLIMAGLFYPTILSSLSVFVVPKASLQLLLNGVMLLFSIFVIKRKSKVAMPVSQRLLLLGIILVVIVGYYRVRDYEYWAQFRYIAFLIFFLYAMESQRWLKYLLYCILGMGLVYALSTIFLSLNEGIYTQLVNTLYPSTKSTLLRLYSEQRFAGITEHYSTNGMMLANALIVTLAFYFGYNREGIRSSGRYIIAFGIITIALFLTAKRAHLAFTFIAAFLSYSICTRRERNHIIKVAGILLSVLVVAAVAYGAIPQVRMVFDRFIDASDDINVSGRYIFWDAAWKQFLNNRSFGIGWFGFRNNVASTVNYSGHCHNVYIQLLCENGIVGFSIFLAWFVSSLVTSIRVSYSFYSENIKLPVKIQLMFSLSFQIYFLLYCFSGNPLFDVYQYPLYFVACIIPFYYIVYPNDMYEEDVLAEMSDNLD